VLQACLTDSGAAGKNYVQIEVDGKTLCICCLERGKTEHATMDVLVDLANGPCKLSVKGSSEVCITGYMEPRPEDYMSSYLGGLEGEESDEEEDEEVDEADEAVAGGSTSSDLKKKIAQALASSASTSAPSKKQKNMMDMVEDEEGEEDDDEDDEDMEDDDDGAEDDEEDDDLDGDDDDDEEDEDEEDEDDDDEMEEAVADMKIKRDLLKQLTQHAGKMGLPKAAPAGQKKQAPPAPVSNSKKPAQTKGVPVKSK